MYAPSDAFNSLLRNLTSALGAKDKATLLLNVELTLRLACRLGLDGEPLTVGWVLLSRMPLHHPRLTALTPDERRMLANAAVLVPLSSRVAWESALIRYANEIDPNQRLFAVQPLRLDEQIIDVCRQEPCPDPQREARYDDILAERLPFFMRKRQIAQVGTTYRIHIKDTEDKKRIGRVTITPDMQPALSDAAPPWFDTPRPRTVIEVTMADLGPTAEYLDRREPQWGGKPHWVSDLAQIRFRRQGDDGRLEGINAHPLRLEGAVHLPAMVSAGKTTLAKLIAAHCIRSGVDARITLVVGDSHTAVEVAHQVNRWFCDDPGGDRVVAVPILGATQRETHLARLLESREYARSLKTGQPHWGERWLMPVCPLFSRVAWEGENDRIVPAGGEPCERLYTERRAQGKGEKHICPLFQRCPAKQMYRDMPAAQLWITTSGALSQAALPLHLDARIVRVGDLVYEQSDLVIFDEVETVVDWFDRTFAQTTVLTNGKNGFIDRLETQIAEYWTANRVLPPDERRWIVPAREAVKALSSVLTAIDDPTQARPVKQWLERGFFTANQLAFRLARRLAGLKEWDSAELLPDERRENEQKASVAFAPFDHLLNRVNDPLRWPAPVSKQEHILAAGELAGLMRDINNLADVVPDATIVARCEQWLLKYYSEAEKKLAALRAKLTASDDSFDTKYLEKYLDRSLKEMAQRLQFMLQVALLDHHLYIVLQGWHNKPEAIDAAQPFSRMPRGMGNMLPKPITGLQYGFVIKRTNRDQDEAARNRLDLFSYSNIGRSYLLDFDHLRRDLEGLPGPHVLALSGTSHMPDSTVFHVNLPVAGVLMTPDRTARALDDSRFIWKPFYDPQGKSIAVSGALEKNTPLIRLVRAMLADGGVAGGFIAQTLAELEQWGEADPENWQDRARILVLTNSYEQAHVVARTMRDCWRERASSVYQLMRGKSNENDYWQVEVGDTPGSFRRMDIEQFAATGGRVLVAPMQAIGRGFNILNEAGIAAFGAVFFLTRPMNVPDDMEAMAQEMNRYALQWAADPGFEAWKTDTLYNRALAVRACAADLRRAIEHRGTYRQLTDNAALQMYPRRDLAATTAGRIVQAVGRLVRGGVPFKAYFIDAAWSPALARSGDKHDKESEATSLLTAVIDTLAEYAGTTEIGAQLYEGLSNALAATENRDDN